MASKRRLRRKSCIGKIQYDSLEPAIAAKTRLKRQLKHENIHVYKCPFCNKYHLGHYARKYL